nr:PREDICTED: CD276 antigen-like [Latimeria chalumnae]|eukprot:XP_014354192.1 PREDICTED: CD276 antigen-like [Latimeria chalumnae]
MEKLLYLVCTLCSAVALSPLVALYGDDVILSCTFPPKPDSGTQRVTINWERNNPGSLDLGRVVHRYDYQRDQLELQDEVYRNRTQIFLEVHKGNASLKLMRVHPGDEGRYTCSVETERDCFEHSVDLVVAAPFKEPTLIIDSSNSAGYVLLTYTTEGGYPEASVKWLNASGSDITEESDTTQTAGLTGLLQVRSEITVPMIKNVNYTFILENTSLQQRMVRPLSVIPKNFLDTLQSLNSCPRSRLPVLLSLTVVLVSLMMAILICGKQLCAFGKGNFPEGDTLGDPLVQNLGGRRRSI